MATGAAIGALAQGSTQRVVGYTLTERIDVKGACFGQAGTYTIGACLGRDLVAEYRGCRIIGMKVAAACNLGRSRMFLYDISSDEFKSLHEQNQRLYEDWNEISFSGNGYTIAGNEELFFGFDYVETEAMATAGTGGIAAAGSDTPGAFVLKDGGTLKQVTGVGMLCVQLIVDVSNMPQTKMTYSFFDAGYRYKKPDENFELMTMLRNAGRSDISSFRMGYRFDDREPVYEHIDAKIECGETHTWSLSTMMPDNIGIGAHTFTVWVDSINDMVPSAADAARRDFSFGVYQSECRRNHMYVEVYADQGNALTAALDGVVAAVAQSPHMKAQFVKVLAPGNSLAAAGAATLHEYYAYTTPSFTINRSYFPCENHIAYDMNDYLLTFPSEMTSAILESIISEDNSSRCFTDIELNAACDEATRLLKVTVKGRAIEEAAAVFGKLGVTLMLVEDGVKAPQVAVNSAGRVVTDTEYLHNDVLRAYLTDPQGKEVAQQSGAWSASCEYTLDPAWNIEKMRLVAIAGKYGTDREGEKLKDYDVTNCAVLPLAEAAGINQLTIQGEDEGAPAYYTLYGHRVSEPLQPGLYVKRYSNGKSSKILVK